MMMAWLPTTRTSNTSEPVSAGSSCSRPSRASFSSVLGRSRRLSGSGASTKNMFTGVDIMRPEGATPEEIEKALGEMGLNREKTEHKRRSPEPVKQTKTKSRDQMTVMDGATSSKKEKADGEQQSKEVVKQAAKKSEKKKGQAGEQSGAAAKRTARLREATGRLLLRPPRRLSERVVAHVEPEGRGEAGPRGGEADLSSQPGV